jgi:hypothetical protein
MVGIVVRSAEDLKAVRKTRSHSTIVIEAEFANHLLISGIVQPKSDDCNSEIEVAQLKPIDSHLYPIHEILWELSRTTCLQMIADNGPKRIRMYPKPCSRREGN